MTMDSGGDSALETGASDLGTADSGPDLAVDEGVSVLPDPVCPGGRWDGSAAFVERTDDWGLRGVEGVRLSVVDVDHDGRPDVLIRRGPQRVQQPDGARQVWLLRNEGGSFNDITDASGLLAPRDGLEGGRPIEVIAFGDVNNDGFVDAYVGTNTVDAENSGNQSSEVLLGDGSGGFTRSNAAFPTFEDIDVPAGASFVDVDHDGNLDLWVTQHNYSLSGGSLALLSDRLLRGDGTGAFSEMTAEAGVESRPWNTLADLNGGRAHTRAWGALARDLSGDGFAELLVPSYGRSPNHLWHNLGEGAFENRSVESGYAYDANSEWTDNQFAACFCASNPGADGCGEAIRPAIRCSDNWRHDFDREAFRLGGNSGATIAGDVDNDGDLDLLTGEIRHWWAGQGSDTGELLINDGSGSFSRPGNEATGLAIDHASASWDEGHMTGALFDFDNDGRLDVYVGGSDYPGNRGRLYRQEDTLQFAELETEQFFEHTRSHGVVTADFDGDGDLDVLVGHSRFRCGDANDCYERPQVRAFENVTPAANFLQVQIAGSEGSNAMAIGATVRARFGELVQLQEVDGGHGHYGTQQDATLHFGLGNACSATLEVRWPDAAGTTQTFELPAGHRFRLYADGRAEAL
ncbi:MAG: CRTAC1 family protein [Myxococcota bacterium]